MKLEYIDDGASDCPLIRFYDYEEDELELLCGVFGELAAGTTSFIKLSELEFVRPINCTLVASTVPVAPSETIGRDNTIFQWQDSTIGWRRILELLRADDEMQGLLAPDNFQWLTDNLDINVLISATGHW